MSGRRIFKKTAAILLLCLMLVLPLSSAALAVDVEEEQSAALDLDGVREALPDEAEEYMGGLSVVDSGLKADNILTRLRDGVLEQLGGFMRDAARSAVTMLTVVILCALAGSLDSGGKAPVYVLLAGVAAIAAVAATDIHSFLSQGLETLYTLSDFSKALLPSLAAAATASGALTSAAAKYAIAAMYMDLLLNLATQVIMPAICGYTALVVAGAALGGTALEGAARLMKWICAGLLSVMATAFTVYLGISGIISGSADALAARLAKTAVSSALPVVGSILSDAAATLTAGASTLRNAVGVFGMLAVLAVCLSPFLRLGVQYLMYKAAAAVAACFSDSRLTGLISGLGTAFGMVLALVGSCAIFLFVSLFSLIRTVT
jgi:stage III sporulation protein AE